MTPVSTIPGLTILPKGKVTVEPYFKVVVKMMYGDGDLYENKVLFKAKPDGSPAEQWQEEWLKKDYGRDATIFDAVAMAEALTGKYDECFMKHSGSPDYITTYAHPSMETWFEEINFEHEQIGGGYITGWTVVYVDSDGVEYSVKFDEDEAHKERVEEIKKGFFPSRY